MTRRDPLIVALESERRERNLLRARYKAGNPTSSGHDRTIGMTVFVNTSGLTKAEAKLKQQQANSKFRSALKKTAKEFPLTKEELKQKCLDITRRHV